MKVNKWLKDGLSMGEIILVNKSHRGLGKSSLIEEIALETEFVVVYDTSAKAEVMFERFGRKVYTASVEEILGGEVKLNNDFLIDEIPIEQYRQLKAVIDEEHILGGFVY